MVTFIKPVIYPVIRLYANSLVVWEQSESTFRRSQAQKDNESKLTRGLYNGYLSSKSKSTIKKILSVWLNGVTEWKKKKSKKWLPKNPYLTFVTLTLSSEQLHWDNTIRRKILMPFLQSLQREYNVWHYYYYCEAQENGNIHFHLLIDSYIHWEDLRDRWNAHQNTLGYLDRFIAKFGHDNPNSTDIHRLEKIQSVENYVMKYMTKDTTRRKIQGRLWGCSDQLRKLKPYEVIMDDKSRELLKDVSTYDEFFVKRDERVTYIQGDLLRFLSLRHTDIHKLLISHWITSIESIYQIHPSILFELKKKEMEESRIRLRDENLKVINEFEKNKMSYQSCKKKSDQLELGIEFMYRPRQKKVKLKRELISLNQESIQRVKNAKRAMLFNAWKEN